MREIKFRAWNIATKTMIDLKKITPLALNMDTDGLFLPFSEGLPLMQYIGLKDVDSKEIYEGDIVELKSGSAYEVVWDKSGWGLIHAKRDGDKYGVYRRNIDLDSDNKVVIGNIYENPELLQSL